MSDTGPILDYASPRKRGIMRLPAVSRLAVNVDDGRIGVEESLTGQGQAVAALVFGVFVLGIVIVSSGAVAYDFRYHHLHRDLQAGVIVPGILAAALIATMVCVVQQTWRRTVLTVEYDDLRLSFRSPLRNRHYCWANNDVTDVLVRVTANQETGLPLGEVLITRVAGGDVHLFTDHPTQRLGGIARVVHDVLRDGRTDAQLADDVMLLDRPRLQRAEPIAPANVSPEDAERTAGRLLDVRRALRDRQGGAPTGDGERPA